MINCSQPFVLLDDARDQRAAPARLYSNPVEIIQTRDSAEIPALIDQLQGGDWAGFISYEAGHGLEPRLSAPRQPDEPLFWFARFDGYEQIDAADVPSLLPPADAGWLGRPKPDAPQNAYADAFSRVQDWITAGDVYQTNLTLRASVDTAGHPLALYAGLRARAKAGYGGVIWTGEDWFLSLSPELFFALQGRHLTTKPMKGTTRRRADPAADAAARAELIADPKQRAENLMIVDLLRNDLSRVAEPGSVAVPHLFSVESYPTIHTMISVVTGTLQEGLSAPDVIKAIFPCGSVTGAPKIRAMEIINSVEPAPRGIYTGSIGRIDANGDAAFNVAIRTLHLPSDQARARLGLGGGIVTDSKLGAEWDECLAKGQFVADPRRFDLIETMRFEPDAGILRLEAHLHRMKDSARTFGIPFDRHAARNDLQAATFMLMEARRIRLLLAASGATAIEIGDLPPSCDGPVSVRLTPLPVHPGDFRLRHKTSARDFYDGARRATHAFEVVFESLEGWLTEGSFTNIFVERDALLLTPPASRGLLPGVLRQSLIEEGRARESDLTPADLQAGFFIGNALRGLMPAKLAE